MYPGRPPAVTAHGARPGDQKILDQIKPRTNQSKSRKMYFPNISIFNILNFSVAYTLNFLDTYHHPDQ